MASPPSLKTIDIAPFGEDVPEWFVEGVLPQVNPFLRDVTNALSRSLDGSNLLKEERVIAFTTGASVAIDTAPFPLVIVPQTVRRVSSVLVINPVVDDGAVPVAAAQCFWRLDAKGRVEIRLITGLDASAAYKMLVRFE